MTRKLIKPNLDEIKKLGKKEGRKKPPPPYKTHAENYYYIKQMNNRTPMIIELINGEVLNGKIEWYDEKCIKIKKSVGINCIVFKHFIKYMYKDQEKTRKEAAIESEKKTEKEKESEKKTEK